MKTIFIVFFLFFTTFLAQEEVLKDKNHNYLGLGIGLYKGDFGPWLQYEHGIDREWSIGLIAGSTFTYRPDFNNPRLFFTLRGAYHFNKILALPYQQDWYFGTGLGPKLSWSLNRVWIQVTLYTGYRYFFFRKFGIQLEFLAGINALGMNAGLIFKI